MALKFRKYHYIARAYVNLNRQPKKKLYLHYQKRHLSYVDPSQPKHRLIRQKFNAIIDWYDEFTGMDEVRKAQKRVLEDEEYFRKCQEERRNALYELTEIQQKLKDLSTEIENTNKSDERYIPLVTQEHKLLKEEKLILEKFARAEKLERESFAALSSSVKLSHEKERAQSERTKYWSIIGSVLGTVIGLLGSSVNNHFKMSELKQLIKNSTNVQLMECINSYVETNEQIIERYRASMKIDDKNNVAKIESLLKSMSKRLTDLETSVKTIEKSTAKVVTSEGSKMIVTVPIEQLEEKVKNEYSQTKTLLFTVVVLSILMPLISKYS